MDSPRKFPDIPQELEDKLDSMIEKADSLFNCDTRDKFYMLAVALRFYREYTGQPMDSDACHSIVNYYLPGIYHPDEEVYKIPKR